MAGLKIQLQRIKEGRCRQCGVLLGPDDTKTRCAKHAREHSTTQSKRNSTKRARRKAGQRCRECGRKLASPDAVLCDDHKNLKSYAAKNYYSKLTSQ